MEFLDSHCHLDDEKFNEDREELIKQIKEAGITKLISAGYSLDQISKKLWFYLCNSRNITKWYSTNKGRIVENDRRNQRRNKTK